MKRFLLLVNIFILSALLVNAQDFTWKYDHVITFPGTDTTFVKPYLCTVDANGRIYVASSRATDASAHNAIYYADSTENVFHKLIDFTEQGDTVFISAIRGITAAGTDVIICANQNYATVGTTVGTIYRIVNGDANNIEKFGYNLTGSGYGTYMHGIAVNKDTVLFSGTSYATSIRLYNFNRSLTISGYGSYVPMSATPLEPGGAHDASGFDIIRDCAVLPYGDYTKVETPFYTSRNSSSSSNPSGGIAVWTGGDQANPGNYTATRVSDAINVLTLSTSFPYGITCDSRGYLWVAGTDSTKKWVKAFEVTGAVATEMFELPCLNSQTNADPNGAPILAPSDVALTPSGFTAYVSDEFAPYVYRFSYGLPSAVNENIKVENFELYQNYPNPFNPSTIISYNLTKGTNVKLVVTNSLGQQVALLSNGFENSGKHVKSFDGSNLSSGIYFYTLTAGNNTVSKKMMLIK